MSGGGTDQNRASRKPVFSANAPRYLTVPFGRAEKSSASGSQERVEQAQRIVRAAAIPLPGESHKSALYRAAQMLGLTLRRAKGFFYGEARRTLDCEIANLRSRVLPVLRVRLARAEAEVAELRQAIAEVACGSDDPSASSGWRVDGQPDCCSQPSPWLPLASPNAGPGPGGICSTRQTR